VTASLKDASPKRQLGLAAAIAVVTGESIALGIFLTPAAMAKSLGSPLLLALVWLSIALMAICGALCYSELAIRFPESGGEYVYLRAGYGEQVAFLYGWMSSIVMYPGVAAALAFGSAPYVAQVLPIGPVGLSAMPVILLCLFGGINLLGTRLSGAVMSFVNILKLAVLFSLVAWTAVSGHAHMSNLLPLAARRPGSDAIFPAIVSGIVSAFFSFGGWWEASKIAGESSKSQAQSAARLPRRRLHRHCGLSLDQRSISLCPAHRAHHLQHRIRRPVRASPLRIVRCSHPLHLRPHLRLRRHRSLSMAAPRVCYAMARSGSFFPAFGRLHPRLGTPVNAILLQTGLSLAVLLLGAFDRVLSYIIFSVILFLALAASTLFRVNPAVRAWWFPVAPIVFIVMSIVIALLILMHDPWPALAGVGIVLCGIPLRKLLLPRPATTLISELPEGS
jgi:APA family basic amino acid/polyamine antiporter